MLVTGQSSQQVQFNLLGRGGEGEAGVVVGEERLVVVRLLRPLSTPTNSGRKLLVGNIYSEEGLERSRLNIWRFVKFRHSEVSFDFRIVHIWI